MSVLEMTDGAFAGYMGECHREFARNWLDSARRWRDSGRNPHLTSGAQNLCRLRMRRAALFWRHYRHMST